MRVICEDGLGDEEMEREEEVLETGRVLDLKDLRYDPR